jgi:hypothetical protein
MRTCTRIAALASLACAALAPTAGAAIGAEQTVTQERIVTGIGADADGLKARLVAEVRKILGAGRLAPFRTLYGEGGLRYHWREPWQMVYTLSLALPHLPPEVQAQVKTYLKNEIAARPPWESKLLGPEGAKRQADDLPEPVFRLMPGPSETPTAFFPYALWAYADRAGDRQTIKDNWPAIQKGFAAKSLARPNFETLSGAIGMWRLARGIGDPVPVALAAKRLAEVAEACRSFDAARASAHRAYTGQEKWNRETQSVLYAFFNLTPEAARFIRSSPELKRAAAEYAAMGWKTWPLWWMAQAPVGDWGYYGEGCCAGPEQRGMLFGYEAWAAGTRPSRLAHYADVPDALIGDCTYLQNLVIAIESFGKETWAE